MSYFKQGATMKVCGGSKEIHGFDIDEMVTVEVVRPELPIAAVCKSTTRDYSNVLLIEEAEDL